MSDDVSSNIEGTVAELYDARDYSVSLHDDLMVKEVTALHRESRLPKDQVDAMLKVAPSDTLNNETEGLFCLGNVPVGSMFKMTDMALRTKINDLGMDLGLLRSNEAKNSSRGFISCWKQTMARYADLTDGGARKWNVCEGFDKTDAHRPESQCTMITTRAIEAGDELSVCYGIHFWLQECKNFVTDRNVLGVWCVLACHVWRDDALKQDDRAKFPIYMLALACQRIMERHKVAVKCFTGTTPDVQSNKMLSLEWLSTFDDMLEPVEQRPAVSLTDRLSPPSAPCNIQ